MFIFEEHDDQSHLIRWIQEQDNPGLNTSCQRCPTLGDEGEGYRKEDQRMGFWELT